jgi:broad specificity phosphatase PhoE
VSSISVALVRHAATAWTAARRLQGRTDPPLSPDGEAQAGRWRLPADLEALHAAGRLGWVASPLRRAVATAERLAGAVPRLDPRLVERAYGAWEGLSLDEVEARRGEDGWDGRPPGGESLRDVLARARDAIDALAAAGPDSWVVVTHGDVIRALLAAAVAWDLTEPAPLRLLPERLHRIRRRGDGHLQLLTLNEPLEIP